MPGASKCPPRRCCDRARLPFQPKQSKALWSQPRPRRPRRVRTRYVPMRFRNRRTSTLRPPYCGPRRRAHRGRVRPRALRHWCRPMGRSTRPPTSRRNRHCGTGRGDPTLHRRSRDREGRQRGRKRSRREHPDRRRPSLPPVSGSPDTPLVSGVQSPRIRRIDSHGRRIHRVQPLTAVVPVLPGVVAFQHAVVRSPRVERRRRRRIDEQLRPCQSGIGLTPAGPRRAIQPVIGRCVDDRPIPRVGRDACGRGLAESGLPDATSSPPSAAREDSILHVAGVKNRSRCRAPDCSNRAVAQPPGRQVCPRSRARVHRRARETSA